MSWTFVNIGYVTGVAPDGGELTAIFDGHSVTYGFGELDTLVPAYAATIHKSQGSEYPTVVIPVVTQHYPMLQGNLLYTGVTRAAKWSGEVVRTEARINSTVVHFVGLYARYMTQRVYQIIETA